MLGRAAKDIGRTLAPQGHQTEASDTAYGRLMGRLSRYAGMRVFRLYTRRFQADATAASPGAFSVRILRERDFDALCRDGELNVSAAQAASAYARGDICVAAFEGNRPVGYCWLAFSATPLLDGIWVGFSSAAAWTYNSFVRPSHRGRGIAPLLYHAADRTCIDRGRRFSIICIETYNRPSIAAAERSRYRAAGSAGYVRSRKALVTWHSRTAGQMALRFYLPRNSLEGDYIEKVSV